MKYLSLFSGIGGFELGIQRAYEELSRSVGAELPDEGGRPPVAHKAMRLRKPKTVSTLSRDGGRQRPPAEERHSLLSRHRRARPICVGFAEIDRFAIQVYQRHFPGHKAYGDITRLDPAALTDFDLICGGFPCQAFSIAGKRRGFADTRGTLFFQICRLAAHKRPRLLFLENVKGLLSHDDNRTFQTVIATLDELGYDLQWQVLNSKDFGVPQNRERVFIVGHLRGTPRPEVFPFEGGVAADHGARDRPGEDVAYALLARAGGADLGDTFFTHTNRSGNTAQRETAVALRTNASHNYQTVNALRRLTPTECERLQSFPDGWTAGLSDTQRYKALGNAVTVNVIQAVAAKLLCSGRR